VWAVVLYSVICELSCIEECAVEEEEDGREGERDEEVSEREESVSYLMEEE
jgi:hypothetical protein